MDDEFADIIFDTSAPTLPQYERRPPTRPLLFSDGEPLCPSLSKRGLQCLRLTVKTRLIPQAQANTQYWASGDMAWWFWAAKVVLDHLHEVLTSPHPIAKSHIYELSLTGPWRCGPWKSDATWLSRFIHHCYTDVEGSFLHPYAQWLDKHLQHRRDFLCFDIFLLQCWSQMEMDPETKETVDTISFINEQPPEVCLYVLDRYMERMAPGPYRREPEEPAASDRRTTYPRADLDTWYELRPNLNLPHRLSFGEYAAHLAKELDLELRTARASAMHRSLPPECVYLFAQIRCKLMQARLDSYIDCFLVFTQRVLDMQRANAPSSAPSAPPPSPRPATPNAEEDTGLRSHWH